MHFEGAINVKQISSQSWGLIIELLCLSDLMIEMDEHTSDLSEGRIPFLDYKTYTDRVFFLPSKDGAKDVMITGKLDIPEGRRATVTQALNQFSNLLNSKPFLINVSPKPSMFFLSKVMPNQRGFIWRTSSHEYFSWLYHCYKDIGHDFICCLVSLFAPWRLGQTSTPGPGDTLPPYSRWRCTVSWSTTRTSWELCCSNSWSSMSAARTPS